MFHKCVRTKFNFNLIYLYLLIFNVVYVLFIRYFVIFKHGQIEPILSICIHIIRIYEHSANCNFVISNLKYFRKIIELSLTVESRYLNIAYIIQYIFLFIALFSKKIGGHRCVKERRGIPVIIVFNVINCFYLYNHRYCFYIYNSNKAPSKLKSLTLCL